MVRKPLIFGDCELQADGLLVASGGQRQLSERLEIIFTSLAQARGKVVSRHDLLDSYWGQGLGSEQSLSKAIFQLRSALNISDGVSIDSVYGRGYRFNCASEVRRKSSYREHARAICEEAGRRCSDRCGESLGSALQMYEMAITLDPSCARARIGFVQTSMQLLATGQTTTATTWPAARLVLEEAAAIDSESATFSAQFGLGSALFDRDHESASKAIEVALDRSPGGCIVNHCAGLYYLARGEFQFAVAHLRTALLANPFSTDILGALGYALGCDGSIATARAHASELLQMNPQDIVAISYFAWIEAAWGDAAAASAQSSRARVRAPHSAAVAAIHAFALAQAGERPAAREVLSSMNDHTHYSGTSSALEAMAWRSLRETRKAVEALQSAEMNREYWLGTCLHDPGNATLRARPTFSRSINAVCS